MENQTAIENVLEEANAKLQVEAQEAAQDLEKIYDEYLVYLTERFDYNGTVTSDVHATAKVNLHNGQITQDINNTVGLNFHKEMPPEHDYMKYAEEYTKRLLITEGFKQVVEK